MRSSLGVCLSLSLLLRRAGTRALQLSEDVISGVPFDGPVETLVAAVVVSELSWSSFIDTIL